MLREQKSDDCVPKSDSRGKSLPKWSGAMKTPVPSTYNSALQSWTTMSFSMWDIFSDAPVDCRPNEQCKIQRRSSSGSSCKTCRMSSTSLARALDPEIATVANRTKSSNEDCHHFLRGTGVTVRGDVTTTQVFLHLQNRYGFRQPSSRCSLPETTLLCNGYAWR